MKKAVRTATVSMVLLLLLCTIVSVQAQTPDNGQGNANIVVQNMATSGRANVVASYYNQDGSLADSIGKAVRPLAAKEFLSSSTSMGEPWIGSMVLFSDKELASVANMLWDGGQYRDGASAASYPAPTQTSDMWYLPWATVYPGGQVGQISVQNADTESVDITLRYYASGRSIATAEVIDSIPVGGARYYDLGSPGGKVPDLPALLGAGSWSGSVVIQADGAKQIAVVYVHQALGFSAAYLGATQTSQYLIAPMVVRRAHEVTGSLRWDEWSVLYLKNPSGSDVNVDVSFYSEQTGSVDKLFENLTIRAHRVIPIDLRDGGPGVPGSELEDLDWDSGPDAYWRGWVVVESDAPICGVVLDSMPRTGLAMYNMLAPNEGSLALYAPSVYRISSAGRWQLLSRFWVASLSGNVAHFQLKFYARNGDLSLSVPKSVGANQSKLFSLTKSAFSSLGENWVGSVYISSDNPIGAIAETWWGGPDERWSTYNLIAN